MHLSSYKESENMKMTMKNDTKLHYESEIREYKYYNESYFIFL